MAYIPLRKASERLGMHPNTLRKYADNGIIPSIRNPAGQRLFDIDAYLRVTERASIVCYCRVSSHKQRDDLERQVQRLSTLYPQGEVIKDIGSGLNFRRKGLNAVLERLLRGDKLQLVVAHRDRLCRFGFDLFRFLIEQNGGSIVVLDQGLGSPEDELTQDLLAILHHFSGKMHGRRSAKGKANQAVPDTAAKSPFSAVVRDFEARLQQDCGASESTQRDAPEALDGGIEGDSSDAAGLGATCAVSGEKDRG